MMRQQLMTAAAALLRIANEDGGIPAVKIDHGSGCWTTADTLYDLLYTGILPDGALSGMLGMIEFLVSNQINDGGPESGSWPLAQGNKGSTMTTGQACAALQRARRVIDHDPSLVSRMDSALASGLRWLRRNQNEDGGWGTEPSSGGEGKASTVLATFYAIMPFVEAGEMHERPGTVRNCGQFLLRRRIRKDGSWGGPADSAGDVCNTARALTVLIRSGASKPSDEAAKQAVNFIIQNKRRDTGLWEVAEETFFSSDAGGYISYHQNTLCDVLVLFADLGYRGNETAELVSWLLHSQDRDTGLWALSSPNWRQKEIETWSTAEWILALGLASEKLANDAIEGIHLSVSRSSYMRVSKALVGVSLGSLVLLASTSVGFSPKAFSGRLTAFYDALPAWVKWLLATIILGAIISALSDGVKSFAKANAVRLWKRATGNG